MRIYKRDNTYYAYIYVPGNKPVRKSLGTNAKLAKERAKRLEAELCLGLSPSTSEPQATPTLRPAIMRYMELAKDRKRSWERDDLALRHVLEHFGDARLASLNGLHLEQYRQARLSQGVSRSTVNREMSILGTLYNRAIKWKWATSNPVKDLDPYREPPGRVRFLAPEEITRLLAACPAHFRPIVVLALNTGMRRGEILGLTWSQIDMKAGTATLRLTKNGRCRVVPLNQTVLASLEELRGGRTAGHVFLTSLGHPHPMKDFRSVWKRVLAKAGIANFHFHDLRHTAASYLMMATKDPYVVKEILGHSTLAMTARYAHLATSYTSNAVTALDNHYSQIRSA